MSEVRHYVHPTLGFSLDLPEATALREDVPGVALIAIEAEDAAPAFRTSVVVAVERVDDRLGLDEYAERSLQVQGDVLHEHLLVDRERTVVGELPAERTVALHVVPDGTSVAVATWRVLADGWAYSLTGSCRSLDFDAYADGFAEIAASFVPGEVPLP